MSLSIIAAVADNGVIGRDNALVWRLRTDMRRFRELTMGKPVIVGRRTWDSIGRPLPGRHLVVLTRDRGFVAPDVAVAHGWDDAMAAAHALAVGHGAAGVVVAGGAEIYRLALPEADILHLTRVHAHPEGDAVFPAFPAEDFHEIWREEHAAGPDDQHAFTFVDLKHRAAAVGRESRSGLSR